MVNPAHNDAVNCQGTQRVLEQAREAGHAQAIEAFGGTLVTDTCWCMLTEPVVPPSSGRLALTDSAKYAHYAPGLVGRRPRLTSMSSCVASAISGRFTSRRPGWLQSRRGFAAAARRVLLLVR